MRWKLLASGHPQEGALPETLGLVRSEDHGATWTPVSGLGKYDWHVLERSRGTLAGVPAERAELYVSTNGGAAFERSGVAPAVPDDLAIDPADPRRWVAATADGWRCVIWLPSPWPPRSSRP